MTIHRRTPERQTAGTGSLLDKSELPVMAGSTREELWLAVELEMATGCYESEGLVVRRFASMR